MFFKFNLKITLIIVMSSLCVFSLFSDESQDVQIVSFRNRTQNYMKFRGEISMVSTYLFKYQDGIRTPNHVLPITYQTLNYTNKEDPGNRHHNDGTGRVIGGGWGGSEDELYVNYHFKAPFLTADNPIMRDNYLQFSLYYSLSPITTNIGFGFTFSPFAFLTLEAGFLIGFGWELADGLAGIGINNNGVIERPSVAGPHMELWFAPTFMMDLAYVMPEAYQKWTHVVFLAKPVFKYQALLSVAEDQPYMLEEDPGENLNGWKLNGEFILGYRFVVIDDDNGEDRPFLKMRNNFFMITAGFYFLIDWLNLTHYYDSPMEDGWGSDFTGLYFGPAMQFDLPWNYFLKVFCLFKNERAFTDETVGNLYFQDRIYEDWSIVFRRIGFFFGWRF